jgi:hypothetical protein
MIGFNKYIPPLLRIWGGRHSATVIGAWADGKGRKSDKRE